jgi:hypothetical protein
MEKFHMIRSHFLFRTSYFLCSCQLFALTACGGGGSSTQQGTVKLAPKLQLDRSASLAEFKDEYETFPAISQDSGYSIVVTITDASGERHDMTVYFVHTDEKTWTARLYDEPGDTMGSSSSPVLLGESEVLFNDDGSVFIAAAGGNVLYPNIVAEPVFANGASPQAFQISFSDTTEIDGTSAFLSIAETTR